MTIFYPDQMQDMQIMALARRRAGRTEEALDLYTQAAAYAPDDPVVQLGLAACQAELGLRGEALATLDRVIGMFPTMIAPRKLRDFLLGR